MCVYVYVSVERKENGEKQRENIEMSGKDDASREEIKEKQKQRGK